MRTRPRALATATLATLTFATLASCSAPPHRTGAAPDAPAIRVATYNIRHGRGTDERVDLARTAAVLRALRPDIVGLQEVDNRVERSGRVDEAALLGEQLGMHHAFGSFFDYQGGQYGMGVLSRHSIRRITPVELPRGNEPRIALAVEVDYPGIGALAVVNVHFDWVRDDGFRFAQATALTTFLDTLSVPYILLGDFNDVPESRTLALFTARAMEAKKPAGDHFTFSSTDPAREIDFIFAAPPSRWTAGGVRVIDESLASDHRPVYAELRLRRTIIESTQTR
jgi:endonuclease/exonuclease/phosphatase family metal-dependent hydrolase